MTYKARRRYNREQKPDRDGRSQLRAVCVLPVKLSVITKSYQETDRDGDGDGDGDVSSVRWWTKAPGSRNPSKLAIVACYA